jgi:putative ABC transport system substrate-binding protein
MRRREFISTLSGALIALPRAAMTQVAAKRPLVAVLIAASSTAGARYLSGFPQGLKELGYVEGRNIDIAYRYADGDLARNASTCRRIGSANARRDRLRHHRRYQCDPVGNNNGPNYLRGTG